jgi:ACR3 family arsenite efflux pump ArsB
LVVERVSVAVGSAYEEPAAVGPVAANLTGAAGVVVITLTVGKLIEVDVMVAGVHVIPS